MKRLRRNVVRVTWMTTSLGMALTLSPASAAAQIMDDKIYTFLLFDQIEYRQTGDANPVGWEMLGWIGGDYNRFWIKSEGEQATVGSGGDVEVQALYSHLIAPFWEVQAGLRLDARYGGGGDDVRVLLVFGFEGLAPYWFEMEPAVFVSHEGHVSARLTTTYDMFITQRFIVQPRLEVNVAVQEVPEFGVGDWLNDIDLGVRLRYELWREYAPYGGIRWVRRFGGTADFARLAGEEVSELALVGGLRVWF